MADHLGQLLLQGGGEATAAGTQQGQQGQPAEVRSDASGPTIAAASEVDAARQAAAEAAAGSSRPVADAAGTPTPQPHSTEQRVQQTPSSLQLQQAPRSVVDVPPAAQQALQAAMADCHSRLRRAVHRSQAVTLSLYQPTPPAAAVAGAALVIDRRHVGAVMERYARLTPEQVHQLETVADCVHALSSWRDAAARSADEGLQCMLPDAVLLALAKVAAASVAPDAGNMRGRHQGISKQQLLEWLAAELDKQQPAAAGAAAAEVVASTEGGGSDVSSRGMAGSCACFPRVLQQQAGQVAELLSEAAAGQRPWVCAEVQELLQAAAAGGLQCAGGGAGGKPHKRTDPAAYRQRLAERFSCKSTVRRTYNRRESQLWLVLIPVATAGCWAFCGTVRSALD